MFLGPPKAVLQVGDVKMRMEKMHGMAFATQRLLHQGRATGLR